VASTQLANDTFHRADLNPLGGSGDGQTIWVSASVRIVSNAVQTISIQGPIQGAFATAGAVWPNDQYSEITASSFTSASNYIGPAVRMAGGINCYGVLYASGSGTAFLQRFTGGAGTTLASGTFTILATDVIRLTVIGTTLTVARNGVTILTATDSTYTTGPAGIIAYTPNNNTANTIGSWNGGNTLATPALPNLSVQLASDTFGRANANPIDGNWSPVAANVTANQWQIVSNLAEPNTTTLNAFGGDYYNALTWANNQYTEITASISGTSIYAGPGVRWQTNNSDDGYGFLYSSAGLGFGFLQRYTAGTGTTFSSVYTTFANTDVIRLGVSGLDFFITQNGNLILTGSDSTYSSGSGGMIYFYASAGSASNITVNSWAGGGLTSATPITLMGVGLGI
jgi:hypothetical protein